MENQGLESAHSCPKHWRKLEVGCVLGISYWIPCEACLLRSVWVASVSGLHKHCWEECRVLVCVSFLCRSNFMDLAHRRDFSQASWPIVLWLTLNHTQPPPTWELEKWHSSDITPLLSDSADCWPSVHNIRTYQCPDLRCLLTSQGLCLWDTMEDV